MSLLKKIFLTLCVFIISIQNTGAYTPSADLTSKLEVASQKIDTIIEQEGDSYRSRFLILLENYKTQYSGDERVAYILDYLIQNLTQTDDTCTLYDDFSSAETNWFIINDGVMGGLSKGNIVTENNTLIFSGNINTNGGGFTSIRSPLSSGILSETAYIQLKLKTDARSYKLTFRDNYRNGISYQADINTQQSGVFEEVIIPLSALKANYFGRNIETQGFQKNQAQEIGFIISDGINGPFQMEVESIKFCEE